MPGRPAQQAAGPTGEPRVIWVEAAEVEGADSPVLVLAPNFESFLRGLRSSDEFQVVRLWPALAGSRDGTDGT